MAKRKGNKTIKEQRVILSITKRKDGMMNINLNFYPALVGKDTFEALPTEAKEMQCAAADIGHYVMQKLAENREGEFVKKDVAPDNENNV